MFVLILVLFFLFFLAAKHLRPEATALFLLFSLLTHWRCPYHHILDRCKLIVNLQHLPSLCLLLLSLSLQLQVPLKLFIALLYLLAQLRLFWLLRGGNSGEADAFLDFFVVDKGYKLEQVDLAENILENEAQVGLGLDRTNQAVEHTRDKVVLHLVSRYYVIVFGSLMLGIVDKDVECSKCVKEHKIGILCFGSLNKGVVEE